MEILVLATTYPEKNRVTSVYIHTRNLYYKKKGIDVTVLNFSSSESYEIDGIKVLSLNDYKMIKDRFKVLVSHAPNLRNHYIFIKKYGKHFSKVFFVFHGHEVLRLSTAYPKSYVWKEKKSKTGIFIQDLYDTLKLSIWRRFFNNTSHNIHLIFVSKWMYNEFIYNTKINPAVLNDRYTIIYNSVGENFKNNDYKMTSDAHTDFITIRASLDGEKYSIDIVNELAKSNPDLTFRIIGKGVIFDYMEKADNIIWENRNLNHDEMVAELNTAKCALMPTRTDAQGLLMCEMATYGIPVITSNIPVTREVFESYNNVELIDNSLTNTNLKPLLNKLTDNYPYEKNSKYFAENTTEKEVELIKLYI